MKDILDTRSYQMVDQRRFAALSGDANPIHLDPIAARRELFGGVVVHGMHALLRALDAWLAARSFASARPIALQALRGSFPAPIPLEREVETRLVAEDVGRVRLDAWCQGRLALHAEIEWGDETQPEPCRLSMHPYSAHDRKPRVLERSDLTGRAGSVALWVDAGATASEFPDLVARTGLRTATELLTLTRLVGMHCPGPAARRVALRGGSCAAGNVPRPDRGREHTPRRASRYLPAARAAAAALVRGGEGAGAGR
jgi:acyl dehydratase